MTGDGQEIKRDRRRFTAGIVLLVVLATAAALLPAILAPPHLQMVPPPPVGESPEPLLPGQRGDAVETAPDAALIAQAATADSSSAQQTTTRPVSDAAAGDRDTVVTDRRRVHRGDTPTASGRRLRPTKRDTAEEWDRSSEAKERGLQRFGGTRRTESAVEAGLGWLAAHQSPDGTWDRFHFNRQCPEDDPCPGIAVDRTEHSLTAGLTGLSLLAFLGAGYTDQGGRFAEVVRSAVDALLQMQEPPGGFGRGEGMAGYNDALATLALAEYYALTRDPRAREPLQRAVSQLVGNQQALGGWDYGRTPYSGRNDTSITAWVVQALHACAAAGIEVPSETLVKSALHFSRSVEADGRVRYSDAGTGFRVDENLRPVYRHGPAMLAAGLTCEQMLGWRLDGALPRQQGSLVLTELPSAERARGRDPRQQHNEYYWYYGTLAMFQRGGEGWSRWNARLRDAILPLQDREKKADGSPKRHTYGSWAPFGPNWGLFGRMGSRVYTTAICTLTLEIYYRHTPAFLKDELWFTADNWRAYMAGLSARERQGVVACLGQLRVEVGEPVLVELLRDADRGVALSAAAVLAWVDSPMGVTLIDEVITTLPPWERDALEQALERGKAIAALPPVRGSVRHYDSAARRGTLTLPRSYVGMTVEVWRGERQVARMTVIQRFTGWDVAVADLVESVGDELPQPGDRVVGR